MVFSVVSNASAALALGVVSVLASGNSTVPPKHPVLGLFSRELRELDARCQQLVGESASLPVSAAVNTGPRLGWHSRAMATPDSEIWAQVDLGRVWPIDAVALVAACGEAQGHEPGPGYGFPLGFRVEIAEDKEFNHPIKIHDTGADDFPNPGGLPIFIEGRGLQARFVRLKVLKPWPRREDWIVALDEMMVLSGSRNVAAGRPVSVSSSTSSLPEWSAENLTDCQCLLGPPVSTELSRSNGYLARHESSPDVSKWVQVDLGGEWPVDEVRLFPARPTDFADAPGSGFPHRFRVEAAMDASFTRSRVLYDTGPNDFITPGENPVSLSGDGELGRFVRVTATRLHDRGGTSSFALSELQVWSRNVNVAREASVTALDAFDNPQFPRWQPDYLVDGFTSRQRILDLPEWLSGLARRRVILLELDEIENARRRAADATLSLLAKSGVGLLGSTLLLTGAMLWRGKVAKRREVDALRARIAADLHDEIGSHLGGIALSAQLASRRVDDLEKAREHLEEIERTARETNDAMRDIVWLLKPGSTTLDELIARLRETAGSLLREVDLQFESEGITPRIVGIDFTRNVYLLGKESLTNIAKHARARNVRIRVRAANGRLCLTVHDDGDGFDLDKVRPGNGLENMRHRASLLGGTLQIVSAPRSGTTLSLDASIR